MTYIRANFLTGRASARRMVEGKHSGVILMHAPEPARIEIPLLEGMGPAWAAMEAMCRSFSAEFAGYGVRAVCLSSAGLPETHAIEIIFGIHGPSARRNVGGISKAYGRLDPYAALLDAP